MAPTPNQASRAAAALTAGSTVPAKLVRMLLIAPPMLPVVSTAKKASSDCTLLPLDSVAEAGSPP